MDRPRTGVRGGPHPSVVAACGRGLAGVRALTVRVIAAGRTGPNTALRFGAETSDLDATGRRDCARLLDGALPADHAPVGWCAPEASVVETAELLGIATTVDPALRSLDTGRWRGRLPEDVPEAELRAWFTDPRAAPHGGESIADFVARVANWYESHISPGDDVDTSITSIVVAMPVAQALIAHVGHGGSDDYWSIAVEPGSMWVVPS